ncbi:hypothetical protein [Cryobacterium tagatosivorans]|uniref:Uncharacterized protein n=1 Tax=Cryobacterium tagatosivorans TaxID=1259199 RepID=A0A4R8UGL5_9MICO|nr:hypothetical protein [Cryobacterium tagatosivorans]TFB52563.1 hypothetical protein E3O23_06090 [Cryobacterium tagatosivorans]
MMPAADGCLLTAGAFALGTAASFALDSAAGWNAGVATISWIIGVAGFFVGPVLAWLLHRRRVGWLATLGAVAGYVLGGGAVYAATLLAALVTWLVRLATGSDMAGALAYFVAVMAALFALVVWLVVDAVRDLSATRRHHVGLDIARILAALAVIGFTVGVVVLTTMGSGFDPEALAFMLAGALSGGVVVAAADFAVRNVATRQGMGGEAGSGRAVNAVR